MTPNNRDLGTMRPLGGGDPIPLKKMELTIGRRKSCDINLDFDNISGKHCQLRYISGVWHVRDLKSTNGTTVNGNRIDHEQGLMPDDNLGIAGRYYRIDYDPVTPASIKDANQLIEEELAEEMGNSRGTRQRSLMELAGLTTGLDGEYLFRDGKTNASSRSEPAPSKHEAVEDFPDNLPPANPVATTLSDDDFLDMIRDDLK